MLGGDKLKKSVWPVVTTDLSDRAASISFNLGNAMSVPVLSTADRFRLTPGPFGLPTGSIRPIDRGVRPKPGTDSPLHNVKEI